MSNKWDERFLEMAQMVAGWSKDPSSRIGAVAVDDKRRVLSMGFNGFPRGIKDDDRLNIKVEKYERIVHAEMNCIYNATYNGISLDGSTMYVYGLPTCNLCALGLCQTGVKHVVMAKLPVPEKWEKAWEKTKAIFDEAGITYEFIELNEDDHHRY